MTLYWKCCNVSKKKKRLFSTRSKSERKEGRKKIERKGRKEKKSANLRIFGLQRRP
jgi:hypothetical protein